MPLIISPKTTERVVKQFTEVFNLKKVPYSETKFWHGNFSDYFYESSDKKVKVLFAGYSGAVAGQALLEYGQHYLNHDENPQVYFVGSVFAFSKSPLELGDLAYATETFSPDSFEQAIYKNAELKGTTEYNKPNQELVRKALKSAEKLNFKIQPTKVYCRITPGFKPDFDKPIQLMDDAMWYKLAVGQENHEDFDSGEYESAAVLATSKLLGIPSVALMDVKDKRTSTAPDGYNIVNSKRKKEALYELLLIVKETIYA